MARSSLSQETHRSPMAVMRCVRSGTSARNAGKLWRETPSSVHAHEVFTAAMAASKLSIPISPKNGYAFAASLFCPLSLATIIPLLRTISTSPST